MFEPGYDAYSLKYYSHKAEITLKEGMLCFSPVSDEQVRKEDVGIFSIDVLNAGEGWTKKWDKDIFLSGDECIPYEGDSPLEINTLYHLSFDVLVKGQGPLDEHRHKAVFCLSESKNGETVIWQTKSDESSPASCPAVSENAHLTKPDENESQPQNSDSPKKE
jgi:hypothetical protein